MSAQQEVSLPSRVPGQLPEQRFSKAPAPVSITAGESFDHLDILFDLSFLV
jgi:hypothetical protein